jgi:membrane protease subunit HflK
MEPGPGRDPWNSPPGGGKRGGDGSRDLEALLKRLRAWFSGGPGHRGPSSLIGLVLPALLLAWVLSGCYTIDEQERGVVLRLGAYVGTDGPGFHWHFPWPVENVIKVNVTGVRSVNARSTLLTNDENIVDVALTVQYRVSSAVDYVFSGQDADKDSVVQQATASALQEVIGRSTMSEVITGSGDKLADHIKHLVQARLDDYKAGIMLSDVAIQDVKPPDAVKGAFEDVNRAREEMRRVKSEAQAYVNDRLPRARGDATRLLAEAKAYRDQTVARAQGDASRFTELLTEYRRAPQVTRDRLYLDAMSDVLSQSSTVVVGAQQGSPTINLSLPEPAAGEAAAATESDGSRSGGSGTAGTSRPQSAPGGGGSNDDSLRSRDRSSH